MSIVVALLILSFLIFFHELGHFLAARYFGVHVEVFSIGFGKRILTKKIGATEFSLSLIPLGGYVRMKGQDDLDPTKRVASSDSYNALRPIQRIAILFAGPLFNLLLAYKLFFILSVVGHPTLGTKIGKIMPNSPASASSLQVGDIITHVNGKEITDFKSMSHLISSDTQHAVDLVVKRDQQSLHIVLPTKLTQTQNEFKETIQKRMIGIGLDPHYVVHLQYGFFESFSQAAVLTYEAAFKILQGLQKLIEGIIPAKELGGVVSIVDITSQASSQGQYLFLIALTALISVNLGILNLLPIPALDGGHIMFTLYEMITKRIPSERVMINITIVGWAILLSLMALGLYNDINRLIERMAP